MLPWFFFCLQVVSIFPLFPLAESVTASLNVQVDPCDDFYEFACGGFAKNNTPTTGDSNDENVLRSVTAQLRNRTLHRIRGVWIFCQLCHDLNATRWENFFCYDDGCRYRKFKVIFCVRVFSFFFLSLSKACWNQTHRQSHKQRQRPGRFMLPAWTRVK